LDFSKNNNVIHCGNKDTVNCQNLLIKDDIIDDWDEESFNEGSVDVKIVPDFNNNETILHERSGVRKVYSNPIIEDKRNLNMLEQLYV
jgi:hypothetical protein